MQRFTMMTRVIGVALGVVIALAALASVSAQTPQEPPFRYYGDGTDGDMIAAHDSMGGDLGSATVSGGSWYIDVDRDEAAGATFTLNGEATTAELSAQTSDSAKVALTVVEVMEEPADCPDDSMMDDDSMMEGDDDSMMEEDDSMMEGDDDAMMSDDCPDDSMMSDDESMMDDDESMLDEDDSMMDGDDVGYPGTGTGGLAGASGVSAGLIGLLIALGAAAIAGLGRVRNRA